MDPRISLAALRSDAPRAAEALTIDQLRIVYQPIVHLEDRRIFAQEALTRCTVPEFANPEVLFSHASAERCCGRLGRMIRDLAFGASEGIPLFVNVHPDELSARWLVRPDDPIGFHDADVYIEITESAAFTHYDLCRSVLQEISSRAGVYLAVDDLGAGHSNLMRVLDLEPKVVKLDRAMVSGLDTNPRKQILVKHVVRLCVELGAMVVAEGIETADELSAVLDSGAHLGQGYLFSKPKFPPPAAEWPGGESMPPDTGRRRMISRPTI